MLEDAGKSYVVSKQFRDRKLGCYQLDFRSSVENDELEINLVSFQGLVSTNANIQFDKASLALISGALRRKALRKDYEFKIDGDKHTRYPDSRSSDIRLR